MNNYPKLIKKRLDKCILALANKKHDYIKRPGKDFSRKRLFTFESLIEFLIVMGAGSQTKVILEFFKFDIKTPTSSSLIQQRDKLKPDALLHLLQNFTATFKKIKTFKGYRLLAVDGSKVTIPTNPNDYETYVISNKNSKGFNILHVNALYDICNKLYLDATIQTYRKMDEFKGLIQMIKRSPFKKKVILTADRGYESYNNIAYLEQKGWNYVIRVKAPNSGKGILSKTNLQIDEVFDEKISVLMTRRQTNEIKAKPLLYRFLAKISNFDFLPVGSKETYPISYRVVCVEIKEGIYQYLITNLSEELFSPEDLKEIYRLRWGIETSFRELKHSIAMLHFHSKKVEHIQQEIYAKMVLYNFCEMITLNVVIKQDNNRKHTYQVNFTNAITICRRFYLCCKDKHPPNVEALICKYISPVREARNFPRNIKTQPNKSFLYRVA
jgi:hypothetical protein